MLKSILTLALAIIGTGIQAQSWETLTPQNTCTERHECSGAAVDGKFYLIGGRGEKPVEVFDPVSADWRKLGNAPFEMHHFQAVTYKNNIYVIGAFTGGYPHETPVANVYIYNPLRDSWVKSHEIPKERRRGAAGLVVYKDKFYLLGGAQDGHWAENRDYLDEYDPATGKWKTLAPMPRLRDHFQAVVVDDKLYAVGGRRSFAKEGHGFELTYPEVDVYDFITGEWTTLSNHPLPTERAGSTTVPYKDGFLVIGGESDVQVKAHSEVEYFHPENGWKLLNHLNRGRHGFPAVVINDDLYLAAGCGNRGGNPELNSIEKLVVE
ncbi:Kelch repeat-containing protein [Cyclobacterium amurskyense]|uniref:Kelch repeat type 1-containing protein n=1 Tax=Cyclobacterium amurskyense TaxID=320787 RepID=A0A0H4P9C9_9BACT|nr:galactose oxidase [Cyclobacterium amurskyense]AKP49740.1 Kelch repeat type 1-containing protein [Cyclobacterium amurskyense]